MACEYCYYRPVEAIYGGAAPPRMSLEVVEAICRQYRALAPAQTKIAWQGGEPTLMGLDFFRRALEIEGRHAPRGDCWANSLQTNGVALDEEWCEFLARNRFLVGVSIDGPPELNTHRRFPGGQPAHDASMRALELLRTHGVEFNVLVVISTANVDHPEAVMRFMVENDIRFCQVIPCTEPAEGGGLSERSITCGQYGEFMTRLFDAWVAGDDPGYYVRHIDNWLHLYFGLVPEYCEYRRDCSNLLTVEWNGDVYPCDFFVQERYRMGNVLERTLQQMLGGGAWREFVRRAEHVPSACRGCEWLAFCHAGCYRHRAKLGLGPDEKPYLCAANERIFGHVFGRLDELKAGPVRPRLHEFLNRLERDIAAGAFRSAAGNGRKQAGGPRQARLLRGKGA
jgi:uncharacterized protein